MARIQHASLSGLEIHGPWHYEQEADPGVVGAGKWWLKKSTFQISRRNDTNTGWDAYFQGGGSTTQTAHFFFAGPASGSPAAPTFRAVVPADVPVMVASGGSHAPGLVPDPGASSGTTKFLREDATFALAAVPYVNVQEQQTSGTASQGTFTAGAFRTRTLNTIVSDTASIASLASNQVTLPAGTYETRWSAPSQNANANQTRLQNITASTTLLTGSSEFNGVGSVQTRSMGSGTFVLGVSSLVELQHRFAAGAGGAAASFGTEVYSIVEFRKIA